MTSIDPVSTEVELGDYIGISGLGSVERTESVGILAVRIELFQLAPTISFPPIRCRDWRRHDIWDGGDIQAGFYLWLTYTRRRVPLSPYQRKNWDRVSTPLAMNNITVLPSCGPSGQDLDVSAKGVYTSSMHDHLCNLPAADILGGTLKRNLKQVGVNGIKPTFGFKMTYLFLTARASAHLHLDFLRLTAD